MISTGSGRIASFLACLLLSILNLYAQQHVTLYNLSKQLEKQHQSTQQPKGFPVQYDAQAIQSILNTRQPAFTCELPLKGENEVISLSSTSVITPKTRIVTGGRNGDIPFNLSRSVRSYRGISKDGSIVIVTLSSEQMFCSVLSKESFFGLVSTGALHQYELQRFDMKDNGVQCRTDDNSIDNRIREAMMREYSKAAPLQSAETLKIRVAFDADETYYNSFQNDSLRAISYLLNTIAASSAILERDVNARFELSYLRLWTSPAPFNSVIPGDTSKSTIERFAFWWERNMKSVERDATQWITYGIAGQTISIGGTCTRDAYSISGLFFGSDSSYAFHDQFILLHEFGHIFGSPHTFVCLWHGGPLDSCMGAGEGTCRYRRTEPMKKTIMSYCNLKEDVGSSMLEFHPLCNRLIRTLLERAPCVGAELPQKTVKLFGYVKDRYGMPLPNIRLSLKPTFTDEVPHYSAIDNLGSDSVAITDATGYYEYTLANGFYRMLFPEPYVLYPTETNLPAELDNYLNVHIADYQMLLLDSNERRDWTIIRTGKFQCSIGDSSQTTHNVSLFTIPLAPLPVDLNSDAVSQYIDSSSSTVRVLEGKYLVYPLSAGMEFNPPYRIIEVKNQQLLPFISFAAKESNRNTFIGIAGERTSSSGSTIVPLPRTEISFSSFAYSQPDQTVLSDSNGIILSYYDKSVNQRFGRFTNEDLTRYISEPEPRSAQIFSANGNPGLVYRRPRTKAFINRYSFSSQIRGVFEDISSTGNEILINPRNSTKQHLALPFAFRYGDSLYSSVDVWDNGALTFGETYTLPGISTVYARAFLYYGYPSGGILQAGNANFFPSYVFYDTSQKVRIWMQSKGVYPKRTFIVQWNSRYSNDPASFTTQIRLYEGTTVIEFVYGNCSTPRKMASSAIGIQGADALDVHSRTTSGSWTNTSRAVSTPSIQTMPFDVQTMPPAGLVFRWVDTTVVVSVDETDLSDIQVSIQPNPAHDEVRIRCNTSPTHDAAFELSDALGRVVLQGNLSADEYDTVISLSDYQSGLFFFRVRCQGKSIIKPCVVVR